jgi:hypothetical protein
MISIKLMGRLGNQMFQYAACRSIAEYNDYEWSIIEKNLPPYNFKWLGDKLFNIDKGVESVNVENVYKENINQKYDTDIFNIPDYTELDGYFQTEKYFKNNNNIKKWFDIKYESDNSNNILKKYPVDDFCYIHFRGGDYKTNTSLLPIEYYDRAKKEMNLENFVVITDDIDFAKKYFKNDVILSNTLEDDFKILAESKYMILSASSFSWWTAWLKDKKKVIGPQGWFNYNYEKFEPENIELEKIIYI